METKCIGCKQIEEGNFPFIGNIIDMEGQGKDSSGKRFNDLDIFFCPVCGIKLEKPLWEV